MNQPRTPAEPVALPEELYAIDVYVDTDWAGCTRIRKSVLGGAIMLGRHNQALVIHQVQRSLEQRRGRIPWRGATSRAWSRVPSPA